MSVSRGLFKSLASNFVNSTFADFTKDIVIEKLHRVDDGQGGYEKAWLQFAAAKCFVEMTTGKEIVKEFDKATKITDSEMFVFQFQFIDGVTNDMRIKYDNEVYNIKNIKALQDVDVWLMIMAEKGEPT